MGKSVTLILVLVLAASSTLFVMSVKGESKTIIVPDDFPTILAAVENAKDGDTVFLKKGTYKIAEDSVVINKTLSVVGEDQANTILVFPPDTRTGYEFFISKVGFRVNADNFKISSLTITDCDFGVSVSGNGTQVSNTIMPGVSVIGSHSIIFDNIISGTLTIKGSYHNITRNSGVYNIETDGDFNIIAENRAQNDIERALNEIRLKGFCNIIIGNSFSTMFLEYAESNMVSNNSLSCVWVGLYGHVSSNNTFSYNRVIGPGIWGILMGAGSYNVFHDNLISNYAGGGSGYGIAIGGNHLVAEHNTFYRNILLNNSRNVSANWEILGAGNDWDNGEEGNYWDDCGGTDNDGDGVGDVPYIVEGYEWDDDAGGLVNFVFGQDNYPLMFPFDIDNVDIVLPEWAIVILNPQPTPSSKPTPEPEPFPTSIVTASVIAVVIVGMSLLVYFKKRKH